MVHNDSILMKELPALTVSLVVLSMDLIIHAQDILLVPVQLLHLLSKSGSGGSPGAAATNTSISHEA